MQERRKWYAQPSLLDPLAVLGVTRLTVATLVSRRRLYHILAEPARYAAAPPLVLHVLASGSRKRVTSKFWDHSNMLDNQSDAEKGNIELDEGLGLKILGRGVLKDAII